MTITPGQVRAARRLLGWWQSDLAKMVRVSEKSIRAFESGELSGTSPLDLDLDLGLVRESLESAGVIFVEENGEGPGVRLRKGHEMMTNAAHEESGHSPGHRGDGVRNIRDRTRPVGALAVVRACVADFKLMGAAFPCLEVDLSSSKDRARGCTGPQRLVRSGKQIGVIRGRGRDGDGPSRDVDARRTSGC